MEEWRHPRLGPTISARGFADFARTPGGFKRPTPELGEHSRDVLESYGVAADRIAALFASGAVFGLRPLAAAAQ